jgi:cytochrome c oxidase cbb3-type subunit 3/ubiquinol-cytochrome c reductase cytochrome c subunit
MKASLSLMMLLGAACLAATGCDHFPGKPGPEPEVPRPEHVLDFATLYHENCAACHGEHGVRGASISLANPVYLAYAGEANIRTAIANGVHGTLMPAFAQSAGGMLTDEQVTVLAHGMISAWGKPDALAGTTAPAYHPAAAGNAADGQKVFTTSCAMCHGDQGQGKRTADGHGLGSIVDRSYLALVSDQYLRSVIVGGLPGQGMPDYLHHGAPGTAPHVMTDGDVSSVVAWLGSHRTEATQAQQTTQPQEAHPEGPKQTETKQEPM